MHHAHRQPATGRCLTGTAGPASELFWLGRAGAGWLALFMLGAMCHELGHLILDIGRQLNCELACHRFAGALLAPREAVIRELGETRSRIGVLELHALKHEYGLSMQGWLHRALEVGVIPQAEYDRMRASFRRLGWTEREPGAQVPPELPRRMEQLIGRAYAEGVISRSRAAELLGRGLDLQPV
ncbi:MAG: hypothetical protein Q8P31_11090 [Bacillota bacterium]|nr:hypothetical protein [Bacillota bacterium]